MGEEFIRLEEEGKTNTSNVTRSDQSNHWIGMREDTDMKQQQQQQGLSVPKSDSMKPAKPFIPDKCRNIINLNKLKKIK